MSKHTLICRRGSFKCVDPRVEMLKAMMLAGFVMTGLALIACCFNFGEDINFITGTLFGICVGMIVVLAVVCALMSLNDDYEYEASETEFVVTRPSGEKDFFFYNDVKSVEYAPLKNQKGGRGYEVIITTGMRELRYNYLFGPNVEIKTPSATPFYLLEINAGLKSPEENTVDTKLVMEQFDRMHKSQRMSKVSHTERVNELMDDIDKNVKNKKDKE